MLYSLEPDYINSLDEEKLERMFYTMCSYGRIKDVKYILTSPQITNKPDINRSEGFLGAASEARINIIQYLLFSSDIKENFNLDNQQTLNKTCRNLDVVKYLATSADFKERPDIGSRDVLWSLLEYSYKNNFNYSFSSAKYLITNKITPKEAVEEVLLEVCKIGDVRALQFLLKKDIVKHFDIRANEDAALKAVVKSQNDELGKIFLIYYGVEDIHQRKDIMEQLSGNLSRIVSSLALSQKLERSLEVKTIEHKKVKI